MNPISLVKFLCFTNFFLIGVCIWLYEKHWKVLKIIDALGNGVEKLGEVVKANTEQIDIQMEMLSGIHAYMETETKIVEEICKDMDKLIGGSENE